MKDLEKEDERPRKPMADRLLRHDLFEALLSCLQVFSIQFDVVDFGPQKPVGGIDAHILKNGRAAVNDQFGADGVALLLHGDLPLAPISSSSSPTMTRA